MTLDTNVGGKDRLLRAVLAAVFSVVAVSALRKRNYLTLLVTAIGAIGLGFNATTCFCGLNQTLGIDTSDE